MHLILVSPALEAQIWCMHPPNPPPRAPIPGWVMGGRCALSSRCQCQHAKEMSTDVSMGASDCPDAFHSVLQSPKKLHHPASTTCTGHAALRAAPAWRAGHLRRHVRICVPCHSVTRGAYVRLMLLQLAVAALLLVPRGWQEVLRGRTKYMHLARVRSCSLFGTSTR